MTIPFKTPDLPGDDDLPVNLTDDQYRSITTVDRSATGLIGGAATIVDMLLTSDHPVGDRTIDVYLSDDQTSSTESHLIVADHDTGARADLWQNADDPTDIAIAPTVPPNNFPEITNITVTDDLTGRVAKDILDTLDAALSNKVTAHEIMNSIQLDNLGWGTEITMSFFVDPFENIRRII